MANSQAQEVLSYNNGTGKTTFLVKIDTTAVGDASYTFPIPFKNAPDIIGLSLVAPSSTGLSTVYPSAWVKTISATAITVSVGGLGTFTSAYVNLILAGEV